MVQVRTKDKVFVAVLLPLVLAGCFFYFLRQPAVRERNALDAECQSLPDPEMFPLERRRLETRVQEERQALEAVKAEPRPETAVTGNPDETEAARHDKVLELLRAKDVRVVKSELVNKGGRGGDVLHATGLRPNPVARRLSLESPYAVMVDVLSEFEKRKMAVVPEACSLEAGEGLCKWEVTLWL